MSNIHWLHSYVVCQGVNFRNVMCKEALSQNPFSCKIFLLSQKKRWIIPFMYNSTSDSFFFWGGEGLYLYLIPEYLSKNLWKDSFISQLHFDQYGSDIPIHIHFPSSIKYVSGLEDFQIWTTLIKLLLTFTGLCRSISLWPSQSINISEHGKKLLHISQFKEIPFLKGKKFKDLDSFVTFRIIN